MEVKEWHASITLERLLLAACFVLLAYHTGSRASAASLYQAGPNVGTQDCLLSALRGRWERVTAGDIRYVSDPPPPDVAVTNPAFVFDKEELRFLWQWDAAVAASCGLRRRSRAEIAALLRNKKVYFVGDSHVRYFHNTLLPTLGGEPLPKGEKPPYKAQSLPGNISTRINVTNVAGMVRDVMLSWRPEEWPDVLVLDAAAWHLKTSRNLTHFEVQMRRLQEALAKRAPRGLLLFWVSPPPQSTLESAPRVDVPREWAPIYSRMAEDVGLLYPVGPAHHLDLLHLALDCVPWCIRPNDGMHANEKLLELTEQLFANVLAVAEREAQQAEAPWRRWKQAMQPVQ